MWSLKQSDSGNELFDLMEDFKTTASNYGKTIILERHLPIYRKTIKPTDIGGRAGGEKYNIHGILFKFAMDVKTDNGRYIYGGEKESEYLAMKSLGHEIKAVNALVKKLKSRFPKIRLGVPLICMIDYLGHRVAAISLLEISKDTLIYGTDDGCINLKYPGDENNGLKIINIISKELNLAPHEVREYRTNEVFVLGVAADFELHYNQNVDEYYCLDFARLLPPNSPEFPFSQMFRPEFLDLYSRKTSKRISSDVFVGFGMINKDSYNKDAIDAVKYLNEVVIQDVAKTLDVNFPENIKYFLHSKGVNVRFLGVIRTLQDNEKTKLSRVILLEIVLRTCKTILSKILRSVISKIPVPCEEPFRLAVKEFYEDLNDCKSNFWRSDIKKYLLEKYKCALFENELELGYNLTKSFDFSHFTKKIQKYTNTSLEGNVGSSSSYKINMDVKSIPSMGDILVERLISINDYNEALKVLVEYYDKWDIDTLHKNLNLVVLNYVNYIQKHTQDWMVFKKISPIIEKITMIVEVAIKSDITSLDIFIEIWYILLNTDENGKFDMNLFSTASFDPILADYLIQIYTSMLVFCDNENVNSIVFKFKEKKKRYRKHVTMFQEFLRQDFVPYIYKILLVSIMNNTIFLDNQYNDYHWFPAMEYISHIDNIRKIELHSEYYVSNTEAEQLHHMMSLNYIDISGCLNVTENGLSGLYSKNLQTLILRRCSIHNLSFLEKLELRVLDISNSKYITNKHFQSLLHMKKLRELIMNDCEKVTQHAFKHISYLKNLRVLKANNCKPTKTNSLQYIGKLKKLKVLHIASKLKNQELIEIINGFHFPDINKKLKPLTNLVNLESLNIAYNKDICNEDMKYLRRMENLYYLNISGTPITQEGLSKLSNRNLRSLISVHGRIGMKELINFENISTLYIDTCEFKEKDFIATIPHLKNLECLRILSCRITNIFIRHIAESEVDNLYHFELGHCTKSKTVSGGKQYRINDIGLSYLAYPCFNRLENLNISTLCRNMNGRGFESISMLPCLKYLVLKGHEHMHVSDTSLMLLVDLKELEYLDVGGCSYLEESSVKGVQNSFLEKLGLKVDLVNEKGDCALKSIK
eukprot:TRINITY_DN5380_c0_g1_i2.p1 TRINITY_DN5380_c0_g1~~TRINITY_DN5380_c0_g1_i2.p1  ORF type:complete len:1097 (+),score=195.84 TRINITY_DN5380_c0_g1_i2:566-3856(+)